MIPAKGLRLGDRYLLQERIAIGGMGEVWIAWDDHLHRQVGAKVLRAEYVGEKTFLDRLRTEARNAARLSHQNIAAMYDYGEQAGSGFLIMELVHGEPLSTLLEHEGRLDAAQLLPVLAQAARALHTAHLGGVVHRDIKPANILLTAEGYVKLTDFGISLGANQPAMTAAGMVMGTAQYLPPEQAMGRPATGAGDIYALGVVAYEALVGTRPFTGENQVDIAFAHVNQPLPPLPEDLDDRVREIVVQMLAKDPEQRPRSGASLARALEELARQLDVELEPSERRRAAETIAAEAVGTMAMPSMPQEPREPQGVEPAQPDAPAPHEDPPAARQPAGSGGPATGSTSADAEPQTRRHRRQLREEAGDAFGLPRWRPIPLAQERGAGGSEEPDEPGTPGPGLPSARSPHPRPSSLPNTRRGRRLSAERARRRRPGNAGEASVGVLSHGSWIAMTAGLLAALLLGRLGETSTAVVVSLPLLTASLRVAGAPKAKD
ncbi:MAG TPA: protein kinase [Beutenbergiaceae bacterium]|nr:protein kinase [Beutenbergiaceae bacterium]